MQSVRYDCEKLCSIPGRDRLKAEVSSLLMNNTTLHCIAMRTGNIRTWHINNATKTFYRDRGRVVELLQRLESEKISRRTKKNKQLNILIIHDIFLTNINYKNIELIVVSSFHSTVPTRSALKKTLIYSG